MNPVEARWQRAQEALKREIGDRANVACQIPRWDPVDLATGLRWLQSTVYEAFYVKCRVTDTGPDTTVRFQYWEYGEPEPEQGGDWVELFGPKDD
jgi:hypothetical protein